MTSKTISLSGAELKVIYSGGGNAWLRNDGTSAIYASAAPDIAAGADGVVSIPAGQAAPIYGANGTVYLLGTGSVMLIGSDYAQCPFKTSTSSGGSGGVDEQARAAIEAHAADTEIHVTAEEKAGWNGLSNPNLLINPDFSINQRGKSTYDTAGFTVDRWKAGGGFTVTAGNGITIAAKAELSANMAALVQEVGYDASFGAATFSLYASATHENAYMLIVALDSSGAALSQSAKVHINSGLTSVTFGAIPVGAVQLRAQITLNSGSKPSDTLSLRYAKLECSEQPTKFIPPDPATELLKCQRYYQIRSTNDVAPVDLRPSMGTITDIKTVEGGYAYVSEL